jgi:shikimate dehydrogenase
MSSLSLREVKAWRGPPLILFVGISTAGSGIHAVFDRWATLLGQPWTLRGVDLPPSTSPETYRRLVRLIRDNPQVRGAVVTAHKLRLYRACAATTSHRDELADLTREFNTVAAIDGGIGGYARDALSLTHVMPQAAHYLCLGAGGAGTALLLAARHLDPTPTVIFADTDARALADLRGVAAAATTAASFFHLRRPEDADALVAGLPSGTVVVNATGLGKDAPGSPITDDAPLRPGLLAWDFNYRGTLTFLAQAAARGAATLDGWDYFVAGWAGCLTAIAGVSFTDGLLADFRTAAAPFRPGPPQPAAPA